MVYVEKVLGDMSWKNVIDQLSVVEAQRLRLLLLRIRLQRNRASLRIFTDVFDSFHHVSKTVSLQRQTENHAVFLTSSDDAR